jgi:pimeloyl-ACP methyl ester carboxylesterase
LIRGVLAAHATGGSFSVLCDARRPDLIENWHLVMRAVRSCVLRCRLQSLTWQETDRRAAQVSAEISGCEIRHCVVTARHALFFTRIGSLIPLPVIC